MLRLLYLNSISENTWGGGEKWMLTSALGLRERGHLVYFCVRPDSILQKKVTQHKIESYTIQFRGDFDPVSIFKLRNLLRQYQIDIIIANFNKDVRLAGLAKRLARRGLVVARNGLAILPNKLTYRFTHRLLADKILTNAKSIKNKYLQYGWLKESDIQVIPNGIQILSNTDRSIPSLTIPNGVPVIGFFGRFVGQKQPLTFLEIARNIYLTHPQTHFLMVGDGPLFNAVRSFISGHNLAENIHLTGFADNITDLLNLCHIVLLTSYKEGLPNIIMETMLHKKVAIAFDSGDVRELIRSDQLGYVIAMNDVYSMTQKCVQLINNPELCRQIGHNAYEFILENYSMGKMIEALEMFFLELCNCTK